MGGTVTRTSVFDNGPDQQEKSTALPSVRWERRSALQLQVGEVFNPFQLFIGAMIPSAVLRNPDLSPSAKLVFARLAQFAGRQGKAWPSDQTLGREVGLGDRQARRCVAELEHYGLIRRVTRAGHSNLFEFLWHEIYEEGRTDVSTPASTDQHRNLGTPLPVTPAQSGEGAVDLAARTEGAAAEPTHPEELCSSEQLKGKPIPISKPRQVSTVDQDRSSVDPEQVFLHRLRQRHGSTESAAVIVQCVADELQNWRDWSDFLDFDERQTTAPERLKNPPGHYRQLVRKFYQARAQKRDWQLQQQQLALELQLEAKARSRQEKPVCPLSRCNGFGEWWNEQGHVVACSCEYGQKLSAKVLEAFEELNAKLQAEASPPSEKRPPGSEHGTVSLRDLARHKTMPPGISGAQKAACG